MQLIANLVKEERLDRRVLKMFGKEQISYTYCFTPEQIDNMYINDYFSYLMLSGMRSPKVK